ncbi:MAG: hypothetical protein BWY57_03483 [Betaproteobacteria bacterium ADurb.Bin341]|nr:MAG: hypothetical protein BWY57_03483 [Betaproteobacteria bacterium ADurb.Bin341]
MNSQRTRLNESKAPKTRSSGEAAGPTPELITSPRSAISVWIELDAYMVSSPVREPP